MHLEKEVDRVGDEHMELDECRKSAPSADDVEHSQFFPPTIVSKWDESEHAMKRISIAMILPSGVDAGDFCLMVAEDGRHILLEVF